MPLNDIMSIALPFILELQPCGRYVICNRECKPIGFCNRDRYKYDNYPIQLCIRITPKIASKLSYCGDNTLESIQLYRNAYITAFDKIEWKSYQDRLHILAKLLVINESDPGGSYKANKVCRLNLRDAKSRPIPLMRIVT